MKNYHKLLFLLLALTLTSCNVSDNLLLEILPRDIDTVPHILKYLMLMYVQMALIRLLFSLGFGIKINLNLILIILFLYAYFLNEYGFFKLLFITFLPNIIYLGYLFLKKLYGTN